jgi:flavin reductase (DIM6/NTAB) family NADH-FMN oxidoreductase RutF
MDKKKVSNFSYPMPVVLVGANVKGKANFMTAAWFAMVNMEPALIAVSLGKGRHTLKGVRENGTFSINLATEPMVVKVDHCGMTTGKNVDKSEVFEVFYGDGGTAPMVRESPMTAEYKVLDEVDLQDHVVVIGEIVAAYADPKYEADGRTDVVSMKPFFLTQPRDEYMALGEKVGKAWSDGRKLDDTCTVRR